MSSRFSAHGSSGSNRIRTITGVWMLVDVITVALLAVFATYLRRDTSFFQPGHPTALGVSQWSLLIYLGGFALVLILISKAYGLYGPLQSLGGLHEQRLTVQSCFMASLILAGALYFTYADSIPRSVVFATMVSSTVLLCVRRAVWRFQVYRNFDQDIGTRNVLIVGTGSSGLAVRNHLRRIRRLGYAFKGFVWTDQDAARSRTMHRGHHAQQLNDSEILGGVDQLTELVRKHFIDEIFITGLCSRNTVTDLVGQAAEAGIDVRVVPDLYEGLALSAPIEYVGQFPTIPLHYRHIPLASLIVKRVLDIVLAACALVLAAPAMLVIAAAVAIDSRGPILYCAERVGRKGRTFCCWKFRTMIVNADALQENLLHMNERDGILFKVRHDPRITRVGRFLRKYSLDELPQLFNVLLGTMSIVGPRPPIAREVNQYKLSHLRRLDVSPGITGLWQVQARQDPSFDQYISLDTFYVDNWSLWLDFKIMIRTFAVVASGTGS
jgi:exopolysaccharide biosynthesis polyprenyl glycosylphosphotransferase